MDILNFEDSYVWFRNEWLKKRLEVLGETKTYTRYPVKKIERLEREKDIVPPLMPPETFYLKIVVGYFKFLLEKMFEGHEVKLGSRLGIIAIRGRKVRAKVDWKGEIKGVAPSWSKTKEFWIGEASKRNMTFQQYVKEVPRSERKLVYCFNEHSSNIKYRIVWFKKNVVVKNKTFYGLTFNRVNRRKLWSLINEGKEYLVSEHTK